MHRNFLVYGANGYTGALTARLAVEQGLKPILAGRTLSRVEEIARPLGLTSRAANLENAKELDQAMQDVDVVLHCAGPFSRTHRQMAEACLRNGKHYLDITGEIAVFESLAARDAEAKKAGIMLMPGAGFDVAPSDCLAAYLKSKMPDATELTLAFHSVGGRISHGTATTMVENLHQGGAVRQNGKIISVPAAWKSKEIDFGRGPKTCMTIPWGDVSTAYWSTKIPNIEVYIAAPLPLRIIAATSRILGSWMNSGPIQKTLKWAIEKQPAGPSDEQRKKAFSILWGAVKNQAGETKTARLKTLEGYTLTALASLKIVQKILDGQAPTGYQTPSSAYGPGLILEIPGTERMDIL